MSKVYETLKKKNDTSVEVYPNIERPNIPDGAINTAKLEDRAITFNKLSDALQTDNARFNAIYDAEDDKLDVSGLNVSDDINCTNIDVDNKVTTYDIEVTNEITTPDLTVTNDEIMLDGNPIKHSYKHIINCTLKDNNANITSQFSMNILSTESTFPVTFNDLLNLLKNAHCENQVIMESGYDVSGYITSFVNDKINIYATDDGTITLHEYEYDELISIDGNAYLFN